MPEVNRSKLVKAGKWRTLESGWNATFSCFFRQPSGAKIKIRYGGGWPFGKNSQTQKLDGSSRALHVGRGSLAYARVQIKVSRDTDIDYTYVTMSRE